MLGPAGVFSYRPMNPFDQCHAITELKPTFPKDKNRKDKRGLNS
jgi:hypothetical protein